MLLPNRQTFKHTSLPSGITQTEVATYNAENRLKTIAPTLIAVPHPGLKWQGLKVKDTDVEKGAISHTFLMNASDKGTN